MTVESNGRHAADATAPVKGVHNAVGLKAKAAEEFRRFLVLFLYLWVLFGVFVLNQGAALRERGIDFTMQGFALINALAFAKVMMVFEMFDPGAWLRKRPLIYPIVYETVLLTALFIIVHIVEKIVEGLIHGETVMTSIPKVGGGGFVGFLSACVIVFVALLPFFGLRNLSFVLGEGRLRTLLFGSKQPPDQ
jgi:hypothetical protein